MKRLKTICGNFYYKNMIIKGVHLELSYSISISRNKYVIDIFILLNKWFNRKNMISINFCVLNVI